MKNGGKGAGTLFLVDTSAVLALMDDEAGADRVERVLRSEKVLLPFVVCLEVFYVSVQEKGEPVGNARYAMLKALKVEHLNEITEPVLLTAGRFKARHRISLANALIASFAHCNGAVLVHKDPEYEVLKQYLRLEALPYKSGRQR